LVKEPSRGLIAAIRLPRVLEDTSIPAVEQDGVILRGLKKAGVDAHHLRPCGEDHKSPETLSTPHKTLFATDNTRIDQKTTKHNTCSTQNSEKQ